VAAGAVLLILAGLMAWAKTPKQMLLGVPALALALGGAWFGKSMIGGSYADSKTLKADFSVNANDLIGAYDKDSKAANTQYREKLINVSGRISETEAVDTVVNIKFTDTLTGSYIIFAFQQKDAEEAKTLKEGDSVSIKGYCSGGEYSDILEATFVNFQRSVLEKKF
jgi:tRNA_anti-like